jgi:hypothetical protein
MVRIPRPELNAPLQPASRVVQCRATKVPPGPNKAGHRLAAEAQRAAPRCQQQRPIARTSAAARWLLLVAADAAAAVFRPSGLLHCVVLLRPQRHCMLPHSPPPMAGTALAAACPACSGLRAAASPSLHQRQTGQQLRPHHTLGPLPAAVALPARCLPMYGRCGALGCARKSRGHRAQRATHNRMPPELL